MCFLTFKIIRNSFTVGYVGRCFITKNKENAGVKNMREPVQKNKLLCLWPRMNKPEIHLKFNKMKPMKIWILGVLLFGFSACQWEEETTLAELYAGTYRGELQIFSPEQEEPVPGQVDMIVAGDCNLQLKFINIELAGGMVDTLVIPALLSLDGQNYLSGERKGIDWTGGQSADAEIEGKIIYGKSELTVYMSIGASTAVPAMQQVVKFRGTRK